MTNRNNGGWGGPGDEGMGRALWFYRPSIHVREPRIYESTGSVSNQLKRVVTDVCNRLNLTKNLSKKKESQFWLL